MSIQQNDLSKKLRHITLEAQGLNQKRPFGSGKAAVLSTLQQLGYVQIDTLSVVARAHHHTFWTRIADYQPQWLDQLVAERQIFEYWFHAASYLPMQDFRYALPKMLSIKNGESRYYKADIQVMRNVYDKIRIDGPQKARDFESLSKNNSSWWNWKPTKIALEQLFMQGDLMICARNGIEKVYDLSERVLPSTTNTTPPTALEYAKYLVKTYLRAYGYTSIKQITHLKKGQLLRQNVEKILSQMLEDKIIQKLQIHELQTIYVLTDLFEKTYNTDHLSLSLLSPFDNSIIHRERVKACFDFDFRLECYTPQEKRKYGYFCLPILFGDVFVGRVDCKAHRKSGQFELIHLHIENTQIDMALWLTPFLNTLHRFARFNQCESIYVSRISPLELSSTIREFIEMTEMT
ncbi:crosslink repair DNA glycosylase YcaQ family protein [Acinetobacter sp. NIPH 2699]|uniref:winged helix-turn-helix domain-containing protein n=1 Tax=Acinetobacter sp. NIPH 2699 TaxID=2923433 RepID=UPI001F4A64EA|nr:crosslink repair DNA glycosylase YcaQ family protein [Acinetobacter sp. NIPH 2699]MCH7335505.1 winged helix DNA-binding domain-containing protein [Acinetobacter sp. NIPH 2699]